MTGADIMTEEQIRITIIFFLYPASSRHQCQGMVRIVGAKVPSVGTRYMVTEENFLLDGGEKIISQRYTVQRFD